MSFKLFIPASFYLWALLSGAQAFAYTLPEYPFSPPAGEAGSTAVPYDDPAIVAWATQVVSVSFGEDVTEGWRESSHALGPAGSVEPTVLVLGRGGSVVLGFDQPLRDGPGNDFAVFENAFRDTFLELAYVEVSSDGQHYVRFPSFSYTPGPVPAFGYMDARMIHGLGGKYAAGQGTPFDLSDLQAAYQAALVDSPFSQQYTQQLVANFPYIRLDAIRFVRLLDVVGDGSALDAGGFPIFDPYKTSGTAGFDLDALGILNQSGNDDTDGDGWSDLLESILGSDSTSPNDQPRYRIQEGQGVLHLILWVDPHSVEAWHIELSVDLRDWTILNPTSAQSLGLDPADPNGRHMLRFEVSDSDHLFWRVLAPQASPID